MSDRKTSSRLDASLLTLYFTVISYAGAFAFEWAYLDHFGVPAKFASVDLRNLLLCGAGFLTFVGSIYWLFLLWPARAPSEVKIKILNFVLHMGLFFTVAWIAEGGRTWWLITALVGGIWLWISFIQPIFSFRDRPTYSEKLVASYRAHKPEKPRPDDAIDTIAKKLGPKRYGLLAAGVAMIFIASLVGMRTARNETAFFVIDNCAVLKRDGDNFLCAELDGDKVTGLFRYVPISDSQPVLMKIGPIGSFAHTTGKMR